MLVSTLIFAATGMLGFFFLLISALYLEDPGQQRRYLGVSAAVTMFGLSATVVTTKNMGPGFGLMVGLVSGAVVAFGILRSRTAKLP